MNKGVAPLESASIPLSVGDYMLPLEAIGRLRLNGEKRSRRKLEVRVKSKAQNAILARFADECGGVREAAKLIGVGHFTYSKWLNLHYSPVRPGRRLSAKETKVLLRLAELTGRKLSDIFPFTQEQLSVLAKPRIREHILTTEQLTSAVENKHLSYEPDQSRLDTQELRERLSTVISKLPARQQQILRLRYGLGDGFPYTLEETAAIFKLTKERIRQIEMKALRLLQLPSNSAQLVGFLD